MATPDFSTPEEWRPVVGFEEDYEVSNHGRIRRIRQLGSSLKGKILSPGTGSHGYKNVSLCSPNSKKTLLVHRMVATAFLHPQPGKTFVNHIDGVKTNNTPENLEWVTQAENNHHAARAGLTASGEKNGTKTHPELIPRGDAHYSRRCPEKVMRGEKNKVATITEEKARDIKRMVVNTGKGSKLIAKELDVKVHIVDAIRYGKNWKHVTV